MAAYIPVPRDLTRVKSKVFFNLTKRQLICFGAAALIGVPFFFFLKSFGNVSLAALGMIIVMLPLFFLAMYEKDGQPLEVREAEKYLGYPYVWGGSSPSTSFDCSGFVSWVINNCGNGWSVGRQTANGLKNLCDIIPPSEAKPGDLIFFQGTYNTSGASHVGIYVGNGMMIHCGDPISYASIETNYWQQHFYCFGRIP